MNRILIMLFYLLCFSYTSIGVAEAANCTPQIGASIFTSGGQVVQRDAAVGTPIGATLYGTNALTIKCVTDVGGSSAGIKSLLAYSMTINGVRVYSTNLPGVGIAIGMNSHSGSVNSVGMAYPGVHDYSLFLGQTMPAVNGATSSDWMVDGWSNNNGDVFSYTFQPMIQLYKIGPVTAGNLNGVIGAFMGNSQAKAAGTWTSDIPISFSSPVSVVACSIKTPNLVFPIGNILASTFGTTIGTIPSGAQNTQSLGLDCDAGANINVSLSGTQNPDVGTTSVLALTGQGNSDVAKGVGVQILYNGSPLVLNNRIVLKQSSGGQETFPLTARYYQTKTSVTTGTANASATLNLTYQ